MPTQRIHNLDSSKLQSIVAAALDEFSTHHYEAASFNRIIKSSGLSKGSMYYYFESKEDLFLALLTRSFEKLAPLSKGLPCFETPEAYWAEAQRLGTWIFAFCDRQPKLARFILRVLDEPQKGAGTPAAGLILNLDEWVCDFLATGQVAGAVRRDLPLDLMAEICWQTWAIMSRYLIGGEAKVAGSVKAKALVEQLARNLEP